MGGEDHGLEGAWVQVGLGVGGEGERNSTNDPVWPSGPVRDLPHTLCCRVHRGPSTARKMLMLVGRSRGREGHPFWSPDGALVGRAHLFFLTKVCLKNKQTGPLGSFYFYSSGASILLFKSLLLKVSYVDPLDLMRKSGGAL